MNRFTLFFTVLVLFFFTGCNHIGIKGHQIFTKEGNLQVQTIKEILRNLNYDINIDFNNSVRYLTNNRNFANNLTKDSKVIVQYFNKNGLCCGGANYYFPAYIDLCEKGIPTKSSESNFTSLVIMQNINDPVKAQTEKDIKGAIIISEEDLRKKDICIYPECNINCDTLKVGDWFKIDKEEINRALEELENY